MFFQNEQHEQNFAALENKFPKSQKDIEYKVACYVAAVPNVFKHFNIGALEEGPFDWYFDALENNLAVLNEMMDLDGTNFLVKFGLELWNGHPGFNLKDGLHRWNSDYYNVFLQCCDLYRNGTHHRNG